MSKRWVMDLILSLSCWSNFNLVPRVLAPLTATPPEEIRPWVPGWSNLCLLCFVSVQQVEKVKSLCNKNLHKLMEELQYMEMVRNRCLY